MRTKTILFAAAVLFSVTSAWAQLGNEQTTMANAHYGRDGFWHCNAGYTIGESGTCEPVREGWRYSAHTRLRHSEHDENEATTREN